MYVLFNLGLELHMEGIAKIWRTTRFGYNFCIKLSIIVNDERNISARYTIN